jgi:predicted nucleotidyltransferase
MTTPASSLTMRIVFHSPIYRENQKNKICVELNIYTVNKLSVPHICCETETNLCLKQERSK